MEAKVLSSGIHHSSIPQSYIHPESERPRLSQVSACEDVPVIGLSSPDRPLIVQKVGQACKSYGFFQVINHGVNLEAVKRMSEVAYEFFGLSVEEKMKLYTEDPSKTVRLSTSVNISKEKVHNWKDYLRHHCYPLDTYVPL
ncbi:hypothetical protein QN277_015614 [Acacia crassicarpa]|uniref:Non-haem dioxygenase N-terminal domain-containing protein n=1 Tax=Acacia crassicarpa TaxID=499986 RepID=A0AAE1JVM3_9FABA|nr:hypothetical protein QN277_015614 [Acacia crassicarpa]